MASHQDSSPFPEKVLHNAVVATVALLLYFLMSFLLKRPYDDGRLLIVIDKFFIQTAAFNEADYFATLTPKRHSPYVGATVMIFSLCELHALYKTSFMVQCSMQSQYCISVLFISRAFLKYSIPSIINVKIQYVYGRRIKNGENHKIYFIAQKKGGA